MTSKVKVCTTVKRHLRSADGSPVDKRRRKDVQEISLDILHDAANQEHQSHHRVQLSHYKMLTMKHKSHMKSP
jgi:hypothetical protein